MTLKISGKVIDITTGLPPDAKNTHVVIRINDISDEEWQYLMAACTQKTSVNIIINLSQEE